MIYAARAMHMAVGGFFFARIPDLGNFHVESQSLACQGMVGVNVYIEPADLDHGNLHRPLLGL